MDPPEDDEDFDDLAWILIHENVSIHVGALQWEIVVKNKCRFIDSEKGCTIYDKRPQICREHKPGECDANSDCESDYDNVLHVINSLWELEEYRLKKAS